MRRCAWWLLLALSACQQNAISNAGSLLGPVDLLLVDRFAEDGTLARFEADGSFTGLPSGYVFVTSTDSNELRVFEPFRDGVSSIGDWARAPNPLETLAIPVVEAPNLLAADEGRGRVRVTGAYVYAGRTGSAELSVVSARQLKGFEPRLSLPASLTAMAAWFEADVATHRLPATTALFVATWDGATARLLRATLPTDEAALVAELEQGVTFTELAAFSGEPIKALQVVPPLASRTFDGAPFCATGPCLALATRRPDGAGFASLVELGTGAVAPLDFGGQVRDLALSWRADGDVRLYGVLDEEFCGGPEVCGGVLSVDVSSGVGAFARSTDLSGQPMVPLRAGAGLITGLSIGPAGAARTGVESVSDAGVGLTAADRVFAELGAFASSSGVVAFFEPETGLDIDYDARRADIEQVTLRLPGQREDGLWSFFAADGSAIGTQQTGTLTRAPFVEGDHTLPWREVTAVVGAQQWAITVFDGYLETQSISVTVNGLLPTLRGLPTSEADGVRLVASQGWLAAAGDLVRFFEADGETECARATVVNSGNDFVEVDAAPAGCAQRSFYSVLAAGAQPLVVEGSLEGYMGRVAPGATLDYQRRFKVAPAYVGRVDDPALGHFAPRSAFTLTAPATLPGPEGAYVVLAVNGYQIPYRVEVDVANAVGCSAQTTATAQQVLFAALGMGFIPRAVSNSTVPQYQWASYAAVPSSNGLAVFTHNLLQPGRWGSQGGVQCRQ